MWQGLVHRPNDDRLEIRDYEQLYNWNMMVSRESV